MADKSLHVGCCNFPKWPEQKEQNPDQMLQNMTSTILLFATYPTIFRFGSKLDLVKF